MFQHSAKPSKSFLHTKIYLSNKSIVFLLLISRGSHILTVCQQSVSSSGSPTLLLVSAAHFTGVMSSCHRLWSLMMSASHVTGPLTEPQSAQSPCSHSPASVDISPCPPRLPGPGDRPMRRKPPVLGRISARPPVHLLTSQHWHGPVSAPRVRTLALQPGPGPASDTAALRCTSQSQLSGANGKLCNGRGSNFYTCSIQEKTTRFAQFFFNLKLFIYMCLFKCFYDLILLAVYFV